MNTPDKHESARKQTEQCMNCDDLFTNKKTLEIHQKKCLALTAIDSFGKHLLNKKPYDTTGKVIVSSQPLADLPTTPPPPPPPTKQQPPLTPQTYATALTAKVKLAPLKKPTSRGPHTQAIKSKRGFGPCQRHNTTRQERPTSPGD